MQAIEIAIDALDIPAIYVRFGRPYWPTSTNVVAAKPTMVWSTLSGKASAIWLQQMDEPRLNATWIHLDVTVPHDEAGGAGRRRYRGR